ncbi:hypothetical protein EY643_01715 [Halioglobus maricola]|uniref:Glycosyltransferase family 25 protein n=1 Tax=Halioglobus maricola TaxID=2601894 RepID=A0A5P9NFB1_9GAMM|nr:hypothetical protein [Halioglobus maricola]QFU74473.1 hypothetical protein EY643_01715 [Halioglobus maricola]
MKIVWCEQSGILESRSEFRQMLNAAKIEYFRLNWKHGMDDPEANVPCESSKLSWSKGRDHLYSHVKNLVSDDDYIVMADDDIHIHTGTAGLKALKDALKQYRPPLAVPYSTNWHHATDMEVRRNTNTEQPFGIFAADLEVQVFRGDFAKQVFPAIYDGGGGTYWYAYFFCALKSGYGALCIPKLHIANTRHSTEDGDYGGEFIKAGSKLWNDARSIIPNKVWRQYEELGSKQLSTIRATNSRYARRPLPLFFGKLGANKKMDRFRAERT